MITISSLTIFLFFGYIYIRCAAPGTDHDWTPAADWWPRSVGLIILAMGQLTIFGAGLVTPITLVTAAWVTGTLIVVIPAFQWIQGRLIQKLQKHQAWDLIRELLILFHTMMYAGLVALLLGLPLV